MLSAQARRLIGLLVLIVGLGAGLVVYSTTDNEGQKWPEYESLQEHPDPSIAGTIAYLSNKGDLPCAYVIAASGGEPKELLCDDAFRQGTVTFDRDGDVFVMAHAENMSTPQKSWLFTANSWKLRETFDIRPGLLDMTGDTDPMLESGRDATGAWVSADPWQQPRRVLFVEMPEPYEFRLAYYSPDREWLLTRSTRDELLVGDLNGSARQIAEVRGAHPNGIVFAWYQPGSPNNRTIDVQAQKDYTAGVGEYAPEQ